MSKGSKIVFFQKLLHLSCQIRYNLPKEWIFAEKDDTLITNEEEVEMGLNDFFSNAVINLKIPKFEKWDPFSENIDHLLKAIGKYRKHPSVIASLGIY